MKYEDQLRYTFQEGKEEGRAEGRAEIIRRLFKSSMSPEEISKNVNVPLEEVLAIVTPEPV